MAFGIPYSRFFLNLYGGSNLVDDSPGPTLLRLYCVYLLFLAINGISEAFSQATMSIRQLEHYKNFISIFALFYLLIFFVLIRWIGIYGIIVANCVNMSARIAVNSYYIHGYFRAFQWSKAYSFAPSYLFLLSACSLICYFSESWLHNSLLHFGLGVVLGLVMLMVTWREEREMIHYIYCILRLNRGKKNV